MSSSQEGNPVGRVVEGIDWSEGSVESWNHGRCVVTRLSRLYDTMILLHTSTDHIIVLVMISGRASQSWKSATE